MLHRGSYRQVYNGSASMTSGGLRKEDLERVKRGTRLVGGKRKSVYAIVSRRRREKGKLNLWTISVSKARKKLKITGFVPLLKDKPLYKEAKKIHTRLKKQQAKKEAKAKK